MAGTPVLADAALTPPISDYLRFIDTPPDTSLLFAGWYNPWLVALSLLIAVFAAYAALDVAARVTSSPSRPQAAAWIGVGALAMGGGTWAMHFIGMLAFSLPCRVEIGRASRRERV